MEDMLKAPVAFRTHPALSYYLRQFLPGGLETAGGGCRLPVTVEGKPQVMKEIGRMGLVNQKVLIDPLGGSQSLRVVRLCQQAVGLGHPVSSPPSQCAEESEESRDQQDTDNEINCFLLHPRDTSGAMRFFIPLRLSTLSVFSSFCINSRPSALLPFLFPFPPERPDGLYA